MKKFRHFGVMLDCSRDAVMKVGEVKHMIDCLHKMGYNTLELYTEDTYEVKGEPYFGYLRGRYTGEELKEIDAYAKSRGIELIPCIQTLAHYTALVRHPQYFDIVDTNDILLIDEPKTYELLDKIFATIAENFSSRNVNIGMDEAHMVGLGKYLDKHGYKNRNELILRHLKKVSEIAAKYGFTCHMWSDMFFRLKTNGEYYVNEPIEFPEEITKKVPENVELTFWDYYHSEQKTYDAMLQSHKSFGGNIWFAGGAWSWDGFAPLNWYTLQTMKPAMQSVIKNEIKDVLITCWGDNGKECSFFSLLPALYAIRQYADGNFDQESIEKGFYKLFKIPYADFMLLDLPNRTERKPLDKDGFEMIQNPCKSLLYCDPFMGAFDKLVSQERAIPYVQYTQQLKKAAKKAGKYEYLFDTLAKLCSVLELKAELGVRTHRAYQAKDKKAIAALLKEYAEIEKRIAVFHAAFLDLWERENKPQGWEIHDLRLGGLMCRVKTCREKLQKYAKGKLNKIEELEEEILPYGDGTFQGNIHSLLVSMNLT
ncbi:MAG: beta-N-acetylhexosaminidase [Clostridia bacterium]|nr:beta-N-acetylhexosaminidase [Clostridia bacterium]